MEQAQFLQMQTMQKIILNDGVAIPQVGFGTFQIPAGEETERAVAFALSCGCRHIDTAAAYFNEADVVLSPEELAAIEAELAKITIHGNRTDEDIQRMGYVKAQ